MLRPLAACAVLLGATSSLAQQQSPPAAPPPKAAEAKAAPAPAKPSPFKIAAERTKAALEKVPPAKPEDVRSVDAIMAALYDVISGPAGAPRDWQRFRSLFYPDARMVPVSKGKTPGLHATSTTPEDYITWGNDFFPTHAFYEKELSRQELAYGDLVHVMSAYETRSEKDGPVLNRGVNSLQLFNDGQRWWLLNITWLDEKSAGIPLPKSFTRK